MLPKFGTFHYPFTSFPRVLFGVGVLILLLASGLAYGVLARPEPLPKAQVSPIHPAFALLDREGRNVLESEQPLSTMSTCGQCHETDFIAAHSFHADLGLSSFTTAGAAGPGKPWDSSNGPFGKFDPLTYRYLSPTGDERLDLSTAEWLILNGARFTGGGPGVESRSGQPLESLKPSTADPESSVLDPQTGEPVPWDWSASGSLEMNCLLCHTPNPNTEARLESINAGKFSESVTATLQGSAIVERRDGKWRYNPEAFDEQGLLKADFVQIQDPTNDNCALCHGVVHTDKDLPLTLNACDPDAATTAVTGQVISSQRINASGLNLEGKADLARAWDIHAERGLKCTDCHYSLNNPTHAQRSAAARPEHLTYDPRSLELGEYLKKPDHNFARGQSAQLSLAPELRGTMRRCESCHDAPKTHADWLPYAERHMEVVACESCHAPKMYAPAIESYDWTVVRLDGTAARECRGFAEDGGSNVVTDLVSGYQPVLMQRRNIDGDTLLAPYNLVTSWFWVYEDSAGNERPVRQVDLQAVFLQDGKYTADILAGFDTDRSGSIEVSELKIDTQAKEDLVAGKLAALGLKNPHIYGQIQPYSINHGIARGEAVNRDCRACHGDDSRLATALSLSSHIPGGVLPEFVNDTNVSPSGQIVDSGSALYYRPVPEADGVYIFGHNRVGWVDLFGALAFAGVLLGVGGHATMRYLAAVKAPRREKATRAVYMYDAYERFWHWLQTFTIVLLLFTGLIIHRPDIFGIFSFRYIVVVHNALAAVLVVNAVFSLFWHLVSGEIRQFIPRPYGFFDNAIEQARYYIQGIFKGKTHPFEKTREKKLNPLQQVTYFGLLNVLLPLQIITGALMWGVQTWPQTANLFGGLPFLAPFHSLVAWLFAAFIVAHVYLTTTGATVFEDIKAMITGWENVEVHPDEPEEAEAAPDAGAIDAETQAA